VWGSPSAVVWWEGTDLVQYCVVSTLSSRIVLLAIITPYIDLWCVVIWTVCWAVPLRWCGGKGRTWSSTAWSPRSPARLSSLLLSPRLLICGVWLSGLCVGQSLCRGVVGGDGPGPVLRGLHALRQDCPSQPFQRDLGEFRIITPKQIYRYLCFKCARNRCLYSTGIAFIQFSRFRSREAPARNKQIIKFYV
jgi:hypothetical protein